MRIAPSQELLKPALVEPGTTPGGRFRVTHLIRAEDDHGPQAYVVESDSPNAEVPLHFHVVEQFQVFLAGGGTFQRHEIRLRSVHFTDRFSTYGPIVAGDSGLTFAVLRQEFDPGGNYMPGSRDKLKGRPGRNVEIDTETDSGSPCSVLRSDPDGLSVEVHSLAMGERREVVKAGTRTGCYCMLLEGESLVEGPVGAMSSPDDPPRIGPWSTVFVGPSEGPLTLRAATDGCRVLLLTFPDRGGEGQGSPQMFGRQGRSNNA